MKKIILIAAAAIALTACDKNDDNPVSSSLQVKISASIGESVASRASDTSWSIGDTIGISSTVGPLVAPYTNLKYTTRTGNGEFSGQPIYFYKPMVLTAYYPFVGPEDSFPGNDGIIAAATTYDMQSKDKQPKIDFLWDSQSGITAAEHSVKFSFYHKMSKLTFAFIGSEAVEKEGVYIPEVKVSDIVAYEIEGLVLDGTFDTKTGTCAIKNDTEATNLKITQGKGSVIDGTALDPLIVFPQKPGNSNVKLHVYTDELNNESVLQHYICTLTFGDGELKPGNNYKYTVQITKVGLVLKKMTIEDWNLGRDVNLTATIDGEWKPDEIQQQ